MQQLLPPRPSAEERYPTVELLGVLLPRFPPKALLPGIRDLELGKIPIPKIKVLADTRYIIADPENVSSWLLCVFAGLSSVVIQRVNLSPEAAEQNRKTLKTLVKGDEWGRELTTFYDDNQLALLEEV